MEDLFVLAIESPLEVTLRQQVQRALETAIEHYEGKEGAVSNAVKGIAAYDAWLEALQGDGIEPNGHAYNIEVLRDARYYGAEFFKELTSVWTNESGEEPELVPFFELTSLLYTEICKRFSVLQQMFPFPEGGDPNSKAQATKAISLVEEIKELEIEAVAKLKEMYAALSK